MKKIRIFAMLLSLACATGFVACDDDEDVKQALQTPSVSDTFSDYQSLDFKWDAVDNTIQYGYKLYSSDDMVVEAGVTKGTEIRFTGLQPASTYKLLVWAFAGLDTDYSTSPAAELTATTAALKTLSTPTNVAVANNTATWDAVENADSYSYTITTAEGGIVNSGTVTTTSVRISGLEEGDYTFSVKAMTTHGGFLPESDTATVAFQFKASSPAYLWKATGTYYSYILNKSWDATLFAYSDGTYSIPAFYGVEGYDLNFSVDDDGKLTILSGTSDYEDYFTVATGVPSVGDIFIYVAENSFSGFEGSSAGGDLWMSYYDADWTNWYESDTFNWTSSTPGGNSLKIDDLVGIYASYFQGYDGLGDEENENVDYEWYGAEISKVDDKTVAISNLYWPGYPVNGVVDFDNKTITISPQACGNYTLASVEGVDQSIVASINDDGSIFLPHVAYWYCWDPDWYYYTDLNITLTKSSETRSAKAKSHKSYQKRPLKASGKAHK